METNPTASSSHAASSLVEVVDNINNQTNQTAQGTDGTEATEEKSQPLSKNAQKKLLKAKRREEQKLERRTREKAAKAEKKAQKAEQKSQREQGAQDAELRAKRDREALEAEGEDEDKGENEDEEGQDGREDNSEERTIKRRRIDDGGAYNVHHNERNEHDTKVYRDPPKKEPFGAKVVIDLGFDDKMTDREIISLVSQCAYTYSSNRKAPKPFSSLLFTSLNGRTKARFDLLATYQNWKGVEWWDSDYSELWTWTSLPDEGTSTSINEESEDVVRMQVEVEEPEYTCPVTNNIRKRTTTPKERVVYLTADSNHELEELSPEETYIIGGIVDKNRYKALCENKGHSQSIRTARLPIGSYLKELPTRKVLTVNQVFDILLKWVECRDWRKALYDVMPQRKFTSEGKSTRRAKATLKDGAATGEGGDSPESEGRIQDLQEV